MDRAVGARGPHLSEGEYVPSTKSVWLFGDTPIGGVFGASYMIESWSRELRGLGWRTRTFVPSGAWDQQARTADEVRFRSLPHIGYRGDHHARFSTLRELHRARHDLPDVILVTTPLRVGLLGMSIAAAHGIPLVVAVSTNTTGMAEYYSAPRFVATLWPKLATVLATSGAVRRALFGGSAHLRDPQMTWSQRVAAHCVAAVQSDAQRLVLLGGGSVSLYTATVPTERIEVIPAGIDPLPPAPPPDDLRWRPGALRVLAVGRYSREKRLGVLVAAVRAATDRGLDVHLALVGHGHEEGALRRQADELGVADRVTFAGPYPRTALRGVYESADVFAFASTVDTQAFVLNEAAHEALPLLVADPDVNPVVAPGRSALLVAQDGDGFADGFAQLRDPVLRLQLGSAARRRAARYTERAQTRRLSRVLADAAGLPLPFPHRVPAVGAEPLAAVE